MKEKPGQRSASLVTHALATALVVALGVPRMAQAVCEPQPCPEPCEGYPQYWVTIEGNPCDEINGTWPLVQPYSDCFWYTWLLSPYYQLQLYCDGDEWVIVITYDLPPPVTVSRWKAPNITEYPAGSYKHFELGCDGGTIVVHEETEAHLCALTCPCYPDYQVTIEGNTGCPPINGTRDLTQEDSSCTWKVPLDPPFEEIGLYCWGATDEWVLIIYHQVASPTKWVKPNITDYPDGFYQHRSDNCSGGTIMVHQP